MAEELIITRIFDTPREDLWKVWTDPDMVKKWWGPKDFISPKASIDLKEGGKYLFCMRGVAVPGQKERDFWSTGIYKKIIPTEKIVVSDSFADEQGNVVPASYYGMPDSFPMEATIIISFEEKGNKTKMILHYPSTEGIEGKMLENLTQGWNESFDKLEGFLI